MAKNKSILISGNPYVEQKISADGSRFYLRLVFINEDKTRVRESLKMWLHTTPRTQDEREHNRVMRDAAEGIREEREKQYLTSVKGCKFAVNRSKINLYDEFEDYLAKYAEQHARGRVVAKAVRDFRAFIESSSEYGKLFGSCIHPDQLTNDMVQDFIGYLGKHCKNSGAATTYRAFRTMVKTLLKKGVFATDPCIDVDRPREDYGITKDILTFDEVVKLQSCTFDNQSQEVRRAFIFCLHTGLRFSDAKSIKYADIDYSRRWFKKEQLKVKKSVDNYLDDTAMEMIGKGNPNDLIFHLGSANGCNKALQHWVNKAGINKHITWHCARHTFCTICYELTHDIQLVKRAAGHSKSEQTEVYTHLFNDSKKKMVEGLPQIGAEKPQLAANGNAANNTPTIDEIAANLTKEQLLELLAKAAAVLAEKK